MKQQKLSFLIIILISCNFYQHIHSDNPKSLNETIEHETIKQQLAQLQKSIDTQTAATAQQNTLLKEQNALTKALLTVMLQNAQQEQILLTQAQRETEEVQKLEQQKQARRQKLQEERQNRPWYHTAWDVTSRVVTAYVVHSLWPAFKHRITMRITDEIFEVTCNGVDIVTGKCVGGTFKPGEWLRENPQQHKENQLKRSLEQDPVIAQLSKDVQELNAQLRPDRYKDFLNRQKYELEQERTQYAAQKSADPQASSGPSAPIIPTNRARSWQPENVD